MTVLPLKQMMVSIDSNTATVTINVNPVNDAPVIISQAVTAVEEKTPYSYQVEAIDSDNDGLNFTLASAPQGMVISTTGLISWSPTASEIGMHNISVSVSDPAGATATQNYELEVINVNEPPVITSQPVVSVNERETWNYQLVATDPDGQDTITYELISAPLGMSIDPATGLVSWATQVTDIGEHSIEIQVMDAAGLNDIQAFTLSVLNVDDAPMIVSEPMIKGTQDELYQYQLVVNDFDVDAVLSYALVIAPSGMTIDSQTGLITWTPTNDDVGDHSVTIRVTDQTGLSGEQAYVLNVENVNDAPIIESTPPTIAHELQLFRYQIVASDDDEDELLYDLIQGPDGATIKEGGLLEWTPELNTNDNQEFVVRVSDPWGKFVDQTFEVIIESIPNHKPVIRSTPVSLAYTDETYLYQLSAYDEDGDSVSWELLNAPGKMTLDENLGILQWVPDKDMIGRYEISIRAFDGKEFSHLQTFTLVVSDSNNIPGSEAKDFWLMFNETGKDFQMLMISSRLNTSGTIEFGDNIIPFEVEQNSVKTIDLGLNSSSNTHTRTGEIEKKGIHVKSNESVSVFLLSANPADGDATSIIPTRSLGKSYRVMSFSSNSRFSIVATADNTTISIVYPESLGMNPKTLNLNQGDTYKEHSIALSDFTGTKITSDKPIAVFGGASCTFVPLEVGYCDRLITQLLPTSLWGNEYMTVPYYSRYNGDTIRILADYNDTKVYVNGVLSYRLNAGEFIQDTYSNASLITSSKPISVGQFSNGANFDELARRQDPNYYITDVIRDDSRSNTRFDVTIDDKSSSNYILIAATDNAIKQLKIDGVPVDEGKFSTGSFGHNGERVGLFPLSYGSHVIESNDKFFVIEDSYGTYEMADPFLITLPTSQQFIKDHIVTAPSNVFVKNYANVVVPTVSIDTVLLDGKPVNRSFFKEIDGTEYSYASLGIDVGTHHISAEKPIGVAVYGYRRHYSYGYRGNLAFQSSNPTENLHVSVDNNFPQIGSNACLLISVSDNDGLPVIRAPLKIKTDGVNQRVTNVLSNLSGHYTYCYSSGISGLDSLEVISGKLIQQLTINWQSGPSGENNAPSITSVPELIVQAGETYIYQVTAEDTDNDNLQFSIIGEYPLTMHIDATTGLFKYESPSSEEFGDDNRLSVLIEVTDGQERDTQKFSLQFNQPPVKTGGAYSTVDVRKGYYSSPLLIKDPEQDPTFIEIIEAPTGLELTKTGYFTYYVNWDFAEQNIKGGTFPVKLNLHDTRGGINYFEYSIQIVNKKPIISSTPILSVEADSEYSYQVVATDPENGSLSYKLVSEPEGMLISQTGLISWLPSEEGTYDVKVEVWDDFSSTTQSWSVVVSKPNSIPVISSTPGYDAVVGFEYIYKVIASDTDGDILEYSLLKGPTNLVIDHDGLIKWTPGFDDQGIHVVDVKVSDGKVNVSQSFQITVRDYPEPLVAEFTVDPKVAEQNSPVNITPIISGGYGQRTIELSVNGVLQVLDNGSVTYTPINVGRYDVKLSVTDQTGTVSSSAFFTVGDPNDTTAPEVSLITPDSGNISSLTDIVATVTDDNLADYWVGYISADKPIYFDQVTKLAQGINNQTEATLASFDPTQLKNGYYHIILQATDLSGNQAVDSATVLVTGNLKVGNFTISLLDKEIAMAGIPIRLTRTYDSRQRKERFDFGHGWTVDYQNVRVSESSEPTEGWYQEQSHSLFEIEDQIVSMPSTCTLPFAEKSVSVVLPNGDSEDFYVRARPVGFGAVSMSDPNCTLVGGRDIGLVFDPKPGTHSTLESLDGQSLYLSNIAGGNLAMDIIETTAVDVKAYKLTTRAGFVYVLDEYFGIKTITDPNGNTLTYSDTGIVHSSGASLDFTRDSDGRITAVTDPKGHVISYQYSATGNLKSFTDELGNVTEYVYNSDHGLLDIIDPLGRTLVKNIYNSEGRLIAQEDSNGNRTEFTHDLAGRQEVVTDRLGRVTLFNYDDRGNVLSKTDALGNVTQFTYDANDNQLSKTDALGRTTSATFNEQDDQLTQTDALGNVAQYTYNERGQELTITDESGNVFRNTYDSVGNLLSITDPMGNITSTSVNNNGLPASVTDALGNVTRFAYDQNGNKATETDATGAVTRYSYDANHQLNSETRVRTLRDGQTVEETTSYQYDAKGRITKTIDPLGGVSETVYDVVGNKVKTIDPLGRETLFEYDAYGRLTKTLSADGSSESKTYDAEGNLLSETDRNGHTTSYSYDKLNRLIKTTYADGSFTQQEYDAAGQQTATIDGRGNRTEYEYDKAGRRVKTTDALGNVHQFAYDERGNLIRETDALGRTTTYVYDKLDRKVKTIFVDNSELQTGFDALARKTSATDQAGVVTQYAYDALGRLTSVTDALNQVTSYSYDEAGNKLTQTDAEGRTTRWTYDALGRVLTRTLPLGQTESFTYDAVGNVLIHTDFNGDVTSYTYDEMGRVLTISYSKDSSVESFTWDANGNRLTATNAEGSWSYTYDSMNRLQSETQPNGDRLEYSYDSNGNKTQLKVTYQNGNSRIENYTYDALNRLATVTDANGNVTSYSYDAVGNRESVTHSNGNVTSYVYDELNRLTQLQDKKGDGSVYQQFDYTLDVTGRRTKVEELNGRVSDYTYDSLYRLTDEAITDSVNGNYNAHYDYDKVGNRVASEINGVTTAYTYDDNDRLTQQGGEHYSYDAMGNTLSKTIDSNITTYQYDARQKLVHAEVLSNGVSTSLDYRYNPDGIRIQKIESGIVTNYLVDSNRDYAQVIAEKDASDFVNVEYVFGDDLLSQTRTPSPAPGEGGGEGEISFYHYDGLGSTRSLSDLSGNVSDEYFYDAFGFELARTGSTENDYLFTGEQYDSGLDNYYLRARYYDAGVGRFTQMDTFQGNNYDPVTLHKYLYANSDPIRYVDPSGRFSMISTMKTLDILSTLGTTATGMVSGTTGTIFMGTITMASVYAMKPGFELRLLAIDMLVAARTNEEIKAAHDMYEFAGRYLTLMGRLPRDVKSAFDTIGDVGTVAKSLKNFMKLSNKSRMSGTSRRDLLRPKTIAFEKGLKKALEGIYGEPISKLKSIFDGFFMDVWRLHDSSKKLLKPLLYEN